MAKKLTLDDLKVQSFVTTLNADQANRLIGGTYAESDCSPCDTGNSACYACTGGTHLCGCSNASDCCDTAGGDCTFTPCQSLYSDCACTDVCTYEFSYCNCTVPPESGC